MYEPFFGFREKPFSLLPDPAFLYLGGQHSTALALLEYGIASQAGLTVVSGEIGSGKTTLVRYLLDRIPGDVTVGLVSNTHESFGDQLPWFLLAFDLEHVGKERIELFRIFSDFLVAEYAQGRRTVLIVDEAQNLGAQALEELRLLSNVNADKDQILQLILVGQPQLRELLKQPELLQLAQRVSAACFLGPLKPDDVVAYVAHRLTVAGGDASIFDADAVRLVCEASAGIPRVINTLCDLALVYAYGARTPNVGKDTVAEVLRDRAQAGFLPGNESQVSAQETTLSPLSGVIPRALG